MGRQDDRCYWCRYGPLVKRRATRILVYGVTILTARDDTEAMAAAVIDFLTAEERHLGYSGAVLVIRQGRSIVEQAFGFSSDRTEELLGIDVEARGAYQPSDLRERRYFKDLLTRYWGPYLRTVSK